MPGHQGVLARFYPVSVWLVIVAAIVFVYATLVVPPVALGTVVYPAYSAIAHSRYRNLAIVAVPVVRVAVATGETFPVTPATILRRHRQLVAASGSLPTGVSPQPGHGHADDHHLAEGAEDERHLRTLEVR